MSPLGFNKANKIQSFHSLEFYATIRKQMNPGDSSPQDSTACYFPSKIIPSVRHLLQYTHPDTVW